MTVNVLKVVAVALTTLSSRVSAFSTLGAGSCGAGDTSINNAVAGNIHITGTTGPLADAGVTFSVNGAVLAAGSTTSVTTGTDLAWSVDSGTGYEGIFVRIESAAAFTLEGDPTFVDTAAMCASIANVQGVDHFNKNLKTSVTGTTVFDAAGTATVDVTVVLSLTQWAHSTFSLTIGDAAGTTAPVDGTTPAPVDGTTPAPVDGTTPAPVDGTTPAPTPPIDSTPAPTPVAVPSPVTDAPTDDTVPTADGECPEGKGKGKKDKGDDTGKGKGMGMKSGKMMKCKKEKTPKEPKTPKAGKGGKGKGDDDEAAVRRRK